MINIKMQTKPVHKLSPRIVVAGFGGAGGNAVNNMITSNLEGCDFVVCNTDAQALEHSLCANKVQLGEGVTGGLGAGSKPEIGKAAAEESIEEVMRHLEGANMVFITAGMGGGTGTGAAPVIAKTCREQGILTVGVVTKPFHFEGSHRMKMAEQGIDEMQKYVDTLIVIPNQNLFRVANEKIGFADAFRMVDGVLQSGVRGVTDLMVRPGLINLDFADIRTAMLEMGKAMMGTGEAKGDRRAIEAAEAAINNPLLDDISMKGARGVIINVTGGYDMTLFEVDEACNRIRDEVDPEANIIFGATFDESMEGSMRVSIVATGIEREADVKRKSAAGGLKTDARAGSALKPAPRAEAAPPAQAPSGNPVFIPASSRPFTAPPALAAQQSHVRGTAAPAAAAPPASSAPAPEPEEDLFEQGEFKTMEAAAEAKNTALRGARYKDSFIPPSPAVAEAAEAADNAHAALSPAAARPSGGYGGAFPLQHSGQHSGTTTSSLTLNPPRMPSPQQKKRAPSLFERITGAAGAAAGAAMHHLDGLRGGEENPREDRSARPAPSAMTPSGLGAPQRPAQGALNIDAPARPRAQADEGELDIPAFLRRQAN